MSWHLTVIATSRSHRRPLVVQSQLSSQPVASCRLPVDASQVQNAGALSICFIYARCLSLCLSALNFPGNDLLLLLLWSPRALTMDTQSAA